MATLYKSIWELFCWCMVFLIFSRDSYYFSPFLLLLLFLFGIVETFFFLHFKFFNKMEFIVNLLINLYLNTICAIDKISYWNGHILSWFRCFFFLIRVYVLYVLKSLLLLRLLWLCCEKQQKYNYTNVWSNKIVENEEKKKQFYLMCILRMNMLLLLLMLE